MFTNFLEGLGAKLNCKRMIMSLIKYFIFSVEQVYSYSACLSELLLLWRMKMIEFTFNILTDRRYTVDISRRNRMQIVLLYVVSNTFENVSLKQIAFGFILYLNR